MYETEGRLRAYPANEYCALSDSDDDLLRRHLHDEEGASLIVSVRHGYLFQRAERFKEYRGDEYIKAEIYSIRRGS